MLPTMSQEQRQEPRAQVRGAEGTRCREASPSPNHRHRQKGATEMLWAEASTTKTVTEQEGCGLPAVLVKVDKTSCHRCDLLSLDGPRVRQSHSGQPEGRELGSCIPALVAS